MRAGIERANPKLVKLARADAINGWDLVQAIFNPNYYIELYGLPSGSRAERAFQKMTDDLDFIITWLRQRRLEPVIVLLHPSIIVDVRYQSYFQHSYS